jgi:PilZ domain
MSRAIPSLVIQVQLRCGSIEMVNSQTTVKESVSVTLQDRRRESRARIVYPIEVSGFDRFGRFHTELTKTRDVSLMGCSFYLHMEVEKGLVLALRVVHPKGACEAGSGTVLFHVVRVKPRPDGYSVGVMRLASENPWINYVTGTKDS